MVLTGWVLGYTFWGEKIFGNISQIALDIQKHSLSLHPLLEGTLLLSENKKRSLEDLHTIFLDKASTRNIIRLY